MTKPDTEFFIGVDGGGTGCRAAIAANSGELLAMSKAGPANVTTDFAGAIGNIKIAIERATEIAGMSQYDVANAGVAMGLAGMISDGIAAQVIQQFQFTNCYVTDDRAITVAGALAGKDGCVIAVGTGSFLARSRNLNIQYVGGWGLQTSDQASGAWLGREALNRTLQVHDGVLPASELSKQLMAKFQNDPVQIVDFARLASPNEYASLAPLVVQLAQDNDVHACALMTEGAAYLRKGLAALNFENTSPLILTGGLGPFYEPFLPAEITSAIVPAEGDALDGALGLARKAVSKDPTS